MSLLSLLIRVIVVCVVIWAVQRLTAAFGLTEPLRTVVIVAVTLIVVLWALGVLAGVALP